MRKAFGYHLLFLFLISTTLKAQEHEGRTGEIRGVVLAGGPLADANVAILHTGDSLVLGHTVTDPMGNFALTFSFRGKFMVAISHVSYTSWYSPVIDPDTLKGRVINLTVRLNDHAAQLRGVEVTRAPMVVRSLDKVVIRVDNDILSNGESALELFRNLPGVQLDATDNITVKGKTDIRILIDGRDTYQKGDQLKTLLQSMSANTISKIEILDNPPAKYAAEGAGGVINIITKTRQSEGLSGNVYSTWSQGVYGRSTSGASLAFKMKKFVFSGSYDYAHTKGFANGDEVRIFGDSSPATVYHQVFSHLTSATNQYYKGGIDWNFASRQNLAVTVDGALSKQESPYNGMLYVYPEQQPVDSTFAIHNYTSRRYSNLNLNVDYSVRLDSSGQSLEVTYSHLYFNTDDINSYFSLYSNAADPTPQPYQTDTSYNNADVHVDAYKLDYRRMLPANVQLEAGAKYNSTVTDNDIRFYTLQNGVSVLNPQLSDHFIYTEDVSAAYLSGRRDSKNVDVQLGFRYEQTNALLNLGSDSLIHRHLYNLFPTLFVEYRLNAANKLNFTSGRRIMRPDYAALNPFAFYFDPFSYELGNPYLLPEYTYTSELTYTYKDQNSLTLGYSTTSHEIDEITLQDNASQQVIYKYENLNSNNNLYAELYIPWKMASWWSSTADLNLTYTSISGDASYGVFSNKRTSIDFNYTNAFNLGNGYAGQVGFRYLGPAVGGISTFQSRERLTLGLKRSFFKGRLAATARVADLLYTDKIRETTTLLGENIHLQQTRDTRRIGLTLSYTFMKGNKFRQRNVEFGGQDEKNRIELAPRGN